VPETSQSRRQDLRLHIIGAVGAAALILAAPAVVSSTAGAEGAAHSETVNSADVVSDPSVLVRKAAHTFLDDLAAHRDEYRSSPQQLRAAVDRDILPFFDIQRTARLVLGRHWRQATVSQRQRFVDAFEGSMLRNYGHALIDFRPDQLEVLPTNVDPNSTFAFVRTRIRRNDGSIVSVNYAMRKTAQGWKAWDVIIEGISYVKSFRDDIGSEVEQTGLEATIQHLESR